MVERRMRPGPGKFNSIHRYIGTEVLVSDSFGMPRESLLTSNAKLPTARQKDTVEPSNTLQQMKPLQKSLFQL